MKRIPLVLPFFDDREERYLSAAMAHGHASGDGPFTARCVKILKERLGGARALLTTSGTHALEISALLLDLQPGDEVIVPAFTFVSTLNPYVLRGARPVFADIREDTLNLDERRLESLVTPRTKAIVPVHYAGVGCEMDAICDLAERSGIAVIEDNAHGLFAKYKGRCLGTFGSLAAQSFHATKNLTCGEGGALLINDTEFLERAEVLREMGTNRSGFLRGEVDRYTWIDVGSSYLPSDLLAAVLLAQLEKSDEIHDRRRQAWRYYERELRDWAARWDVRLPAIPDRCEPSFHIFYLLLPTPAARDGLMAHLKDRGIQSAFHFLPLPLSDMGRRFGGREGLCPVTEGISARLLRLPLYPALSPEDLARVAGAVVEYRP